ncbi:MAG: hypothetical protein IPL55_09775 [Saprospiraceae bacterium]|nr:hypothetical protein [Saprospiraceae bacterium]
MVGLEKLSRLIRNLHYEWSFEVRNVNIEKTFGWVGVDVEGIGFSGLVRIFGTKTSL